MEPTTQELHQEATQALDHTPPHHEPLHHDPAFWVAISFLLFVLLAARYIWPPVARALDSRADTIRDQLEQAARLRAEAEELLAQYEAQRQQMARDAEEILANAHRDAQAIRENAARELQATLARRAAQAEENIARAEREALADLRAHLVEVATEAARTMVAEQLKTQKDDPAISRALAAIERQLH